MSKKAVFRIRRAIGIVAFILGIYLMGAYINKVLPFGIVTESVGVNGVWAYTGWFIAIIVITYGFLMIFSHKFNEIVHKLFKGEL